MMNRRQLFKYLRIAAIVSPFLLGANIALGSVSSHLINSTSVPIKITGSSKSDASKWKRRPKRGFLLKIGKGMSWSISHTDWYGGHIYSNVSLKAVLNKKRYSCFIHTSSARNYATSPYAYMICTPSGGPLKLIKTKKGDKFNPSYKFVIYYSD